MDQKKGNRPPDPQSLRDALRHSPLGRWLDERETGLVLGTAVWPRCGRAMSCSVKGTRSGMCPSSCPAR